MKPSVLGTLSTQQFLRRHWQKRPLLVRAALPQIDAMVGAADLIALASREEVESRLVTHVRGRWQVTHGPFTRRALKALPARGWSLLVQGAEMHVAAARELLARFSFIPYARQDDVMLSLAPPGSGVGAHFDSYDVFLIQARGRRRWRIGAQADLRLVDDAPLRILRKFRPQQEFVTQPGDLLYLPPQYAHEGTALTDCITCSVGLRAPSRQEIVSGFLQWLPEALRLDGRYRDPDLELQSHPAQISRRMIERIEDMLSAIRWQRRHVEQFLGEHLTEPKSHVWFEPPAPPLAFAPFLQHARLRGIKLGLKTKMLYRGRRMFINGDAHDIPTPARKAMAILADQREIRPWPPGSPRAGRQLYDWYKSGYVELV